MFILDLRHNRMKVQYCKKKKTFHAKSNQDKVEVDRVIRDKIDFNKIYFIYIRSISRELKEEIHSSTIIFEGINILFSIL